MFLKVCISHPVRHPLNVCVLFCYSVLIIITDASYLQYILDIYAVDADDDEQVSVIYNVNDM